jgi:sugar phosphate isomerase/epimerase
VKRWPEPEKWTEIIANDLDLDLLQFCFDLLDPRLSPSAMTEMTSAILDSCSRYGLSIPCCINGFIAYSQNLLLHPVKSVRADALDWWEKAIALASKLGARTCGGYLGAMSSEASRDQAARRYLENSVIDDVRHLAKYGASLGQESFIWEAMPARNEIPATMSETRRVLEDANRGAEIPVELLLDIGHPYGPGLPQNERDSYRWLSEFAPRSYCIHLQQTDQAGDRHWPFIAEYNRIGLISGERVVSTIERSGARECLLILELVHPTVAPDSQVVSDHKVSIRYWKDALGL